MNFRIRTSMWRRRWRRWISILVWIMLLLCIFVDEGVLFGGCIQLG